MRILLALDGSNNAVRAEELLHRSASGHAHRVTVFNATPPVLASPDGGQSITEALKLSGEAVAKASAAMLGAVPRWSVGWKVDEAADVAAAVLDRARKAEMVVLGARGLTPFKSFLLGSVSQKVSQYCASSVMIARSRVSLRGFRILACVDGSAPSRRALDFLLRLGLPKDARVTLLYAAPDPMEAFLAAGVGITAGGLEQPLVAVPQASTAEIRQKGDRILSDARRRLSLFGRRVEAVLSEGNAAGEILRVAESRGADLIVMGRRGLSKLDRFLMGSVSQKVSVHATSSILIVK